MIVPHTEIIVTKDGAEIARKTVRPGDYVIGRDAACDLAVEAEQVAGRHAQLTINYDHALVEDLGSESGTFVNGQRVTEATRLWPNQKIKVGSTTVELRRVKTDSGPDHSLAPQTAAMRKMLPEEFLRDKKYEIGGMVARGGMGAILDATEATIERKVAMKVMLENSSQEDLARFVAEAKITGQLEHPNIVPVHELNVDENEQVFYTMKFVKGATLRAELERLREGDAEAVRKYPLPTLLTIFQKVCDALAFAHSKRVIHRDLKPDNIMVGDFGEVLLMDWGLAKVLDPKKPAAAGAAPAAEEQMRSMVRTIDRDQAGSATLAGSIMGTPQYMSPEQARGEIEGIDVRSDIFALGAILYHILCLQPPFQGETLDDILCQVRSGKIVPPSQRATEARKRPAAPAPPALPDNAPTLEQPPGAPAPGPTPQPAVQSAARQVVACAHLAGGVVPASLEAVVLKAMAPEKVDRYQNVADLQRDIAAYQNGFATAAEHATVMKQLILLIKRHKGVFVTAFGAWFLITALAVWFIINIRASERKAARNAEIAEQNAQEAQRNAHTAAENAKKAEHNAEIAAANENKAEHNAELAKANEQQALQRGEATRRALAKSQITLAEAAFRGGDQGGIQAALAGVPEDLRDTNWNYLFEQSDTSIATLRSHKDPRIAYATPHPKMPGVFATIAYDGWVALVEVKTGARLKEFPVEFNDKAGGRCRLALSPDGEQLAIARKEGGTVLYEVKEGKKLAEWESPEGIGSLEFSPDGKQLLEVTSYAYDTGQINLREAASGRLLWSRPDPGNRAAFYPDGHTILAASKSTLNIVKAADGTSARLLPKTKNWIQALAIQPDGKRLWVGETYGTVTCLDNTDGHPIHEFHIDCNGFKAMAYVPDGNRLVTLTDHPSGRISLQVWDAETGNLLETLLGAAPNSAFISIHPATNELVVSGGYTGRVWNLALPTARQGIAGGKVPRKLAFWGNDDWILARGRLWPLKSGAAPETPIQVNSDLSCNVSADGRFAAVWKFRKPYGFHLLKLNGQKIEEVASFQLSNSAANHPLSLSPTGQRVLAYDAVLDAASGASLVSLERPKELKIAAIDFACWLNDAQIVAAVITKAERGQPGSEQCINLWDATNGKLLRSVVCGSPIYALAVAPDGSSIAEAGSDKMVRLRDPATIEVTREFRAHNDAITGLAFHPSQPVLASCSEDLTLKLWNLQNERLIQELRGPIMAARDPVFSPGGKRLACIAGDQSGWVWELESINLDGAGAKDADGWEDLLAQLKRDDVARHGNGWVMNSGVLLSPTKAYSPLALPGDFAQSSYQVRVKLRQFQADAGSFGVILPVGSRQVAFFLDGYPSDGFVTSLATISGKEGKTAPGAIKGKQLHDSDQHELGLGVHLDGASVRIEASLDEQPLYEWSGPATALGLNAKWGDLPQGSIVLGGLQPNWAVYALKIKRLK